MFEMQYVRMRQTGRGKVFLFVLEIMCIFAF